MTEKSPDYNRGYAAGRRRGERDDRDLAYQQQRHLARYALAAAIVPEILRKPWVTNDGKPIQTAAGHAGVITDIVLQIEKQLG